MCVCVCLCVCVALDQDWGLKTCIFCHFPLCLDGFLLLQVLLVIFSGMWILAISLDHGVGFEVYLYLIENHF